MAGCAVGGREGETPSPPSSPLISRRRLGQWEHSVGRSRRPLFPIDGRGDAHTHTRTPSTLTHRQTHTSIRMLSRHTTTGVKTPPHTIHMPQTLPPLHPLKLSIHLFIYSLISRRGDEFDRPSHSDLELIAKLIALKKFFKKK